MAKNDPIDVCLCQALPLIDESQIIQQACELASIEAPTDSGSFAASAEHMRQAFVSHGAQVDILRFPADGVTQFQSWTAPIGFLTKSASCAIVEPQAHACLLGDRDTEPNTAFVGTGYTGPRGISASVVQVHQASDLASMDVRGKIIYCNDINPAALRSAALSGGAVGIVSSYSEHRLKNYQHVRWINAWDSQPDGWLPTAQAAQENLPGISLSPEMGDRLKASLAEGEVTLQIITEGEFFSGELPAVLSRIEGQTQECVLLTGHLFEQGLTDNAIGAAIGLGVSSIVQELSNTESQRFRRSLLNFHSQECYGVLALSQYHPEMISPATAHLNIDMIGVPAPSLHLMPGLNASSGVCGFVMKRMLEQAKNYVSGCSYKSGSAFDINCTLLADPLLGGIPTTQLEQLNPYWHTSHDRPGALEIDRQTVRYVTLAAAAWALFMLSAGENEARWLSHEYQNEIREMLAHGTVADASIYLKIAKQELLHAASLAPDNARQRLLDEVETFVDGLQDSLKHGATIVPAGSADQVAKSQSLFPRALLGGPAIDACFSAEQLAIIGKPRWDPVQLILKTWANGSRSIYDITRLTTYETGKPISLQYALDFFDVYARQGLVSLANTPGGNTR